MFLRLGLRHIIYIGLSDEEIRCKIFNRKLRACNLTASEINIFGIVSLTENYTDI